VQMCTHAKEQRRETKNEAEHEIYLEKQKAGRKYQKETQRYAKRLLKAIDAAGLSADTMIQWHRYIVGETVSTIRQWAAGEFGDPAEWDRAELSPDRLDNAIVVANLLGCSTDYLMGLTDNLMVREASAVNQAKTESVTETEDEPLELAEDESDSFSQLPDDILEDSHPVFQSRWESRVRTPPVGKLIMTYNMTNDGPSYLPAIWDGNKFQAPNKKRTYTGLQYTYWLEVPPPGSWEALEVSRPAPDGQLVISGWMPGDTYPFEPCEVVADVLLEDQSEYRVICLFDGECFKMMHSKVVFEAEVIRWMALPPVMGENAK